MRAQFDGIVVDCVAADEPTLQEQVALSSSCTHIALTPTTYVLTTELKLAKNVTIIGNGAMVDAKGSADLERRVASVRAGVRVELRELVLKGGYASGGGAIGTSGNLIIIDCNVTQNSAVSAFNRVMRVHSTSVSSRSSHD